MFEVNWVNSLSHRFNRTVNQLMGGVEDWKHRKRGKSYSIQWKRSTMCQPSVSRWLLWCGDLLATKLWKVVISWVLGVFFFSVRLGMWLGELTQLISTNNIILLDMEITRYYWCDLLEILNKSSISFFIYRSHLFIFS